MGVAAYTCAIHLLLLLARVQLLLEAMSAHAQHPAMCESQRIAGAHVISELLHSKNAV